MRTTYRRPRGTATDTVQMHVTVTPEVKALADQYAAAAGAPLWAIIEAAILAGTPDESGVPPEWSVWTPKDTLPGIEQETRKTA